MDSPLVEQTEELMNGQRILFISPQPFFAWRGSPIRVRFTLETLVRAGYRVDLLTLPFGQPVELPGLRIFRVPGLPWLRDISIGPSPAKIYFDAVLLLAGLWLILTRRYDVVHGFEEGGFIAALLTRLNRRPCIVEKHSDLASHKAGRCLRWILKLYERCEIWAGRRAAGRIGTGPALVEFWETALPGLPASLISDIPSSQEVPSAEVVDQKRKQLCPEVGGLVALYVGSFAAYQGLDLLFAALPQALEESPALRVVVVGGSPAERRIKQESLGVWSERVRFLPPVPPAELGAMLQAADILLSPRIAGTNTPLKLLDYLNAGKAILATDHPSNRLILDDSIGLLVPCTPGGIAAGLKQLVDQPGLRESMGLRQRAILGEKYSHRVFETKLLELYAHLPFPTRQHAGEAKENSD